MLKPILFTIALGITATMAPLTDNSALAVKKGDGYPAIKTKHRSAGELSQTKVKGHVTIINFWATWCAACKVELVEMKKLFAPLAANKKVKFAFVSLDKDTSKAAKYIDGSFGKTSIIGANLFYDPTFELAESFELASFPTTLVVDEKGKIVFIQEGFKEGNGSTEKIVHLAKEMAK
jgi:cytochrome c biogenesis protein CcmG, thiol:disulfide interchange protein DsbE